MVEDQCDCEIANYYVALPLQQQLHLHSSIRTFFERVFHKTLNLDLGLLCCCEG